MGSGGAGGCGGSEGGDSGGGEEEGGGREGGEEEGGGREGGEEEGGGREAVKGSASEEAIVLSMVSRDPKGSSVKGSCSNTLACGVAAAVG